MEKQKYKQLEVKFSRLIGEVIVKAEARENQSCVRFECESGKLYVLKHTENCCESVWLESTEGLDTLLGKVVNVNVEDEDISMPEGCDPHNDVWAGTFYRIETNESVADIRFCGYTNSVYALNASLYQLTLIVSV